MSIPTATPETVGLCTDRLTRIAPAIDKWVQRGTIAGATMMIARHGQIAYHEQVGQLDKESGTPMPADALFRIYSMTKPIICTALMTLYEEGHFQLHTPAAKFIPELANLKVLETDANGNSRQVDQTMPITVGSLMSHTAGFTYDFLINTPVSEMYRQAKIGNDASRTLEQAIREAARLPLAYQPHSRWHYSISIDAAAYLIQVLADKPVRDVLHERIFQPLGMTETDFCIPEAKLHRLAGMYGVDDIVGEGVTGLQMFIDWQQGVHKKLNVDVTYPLHAPETFQRGGHGLYSTMQDYMQFAMMLLNNGERNGARILGRKTVELMHSNRLPAHLMPIELGGNPIPGYGFGLGSRTLMDVGLGGLPGSIGEYGWA